MNKKLRSSVKVLALLVLMGNGLAFVQLATTNLTEKRKRGQKKKKASELFIVAEDEKGGRREDRRS